jgi:hypothetical protein
MLRPDPQAKTDNRDERQQPSEKHRHSNRSRHLSSSSVGTISQRASTPAAIAGVKRCDQRLSRVKSGHFKLTHYPEIAGCASRTRRVARAPSAHGQPGAPGSHSPLDIPTEALFSFRSHTDEDPARHAPRREFAVQDRPNQWSRRDCSPHQQSVSRPRRL